MGQKTHPIGFRLGIVKDWNATWFNERHFADWLNEDLLVRKYVQARVGAAGVESIKIKRFREKVIIIVATSRPGVVIGKKGTKADQLRAELQKMIGKNVKLDVEEVKKPELSAPLVADHIAAQLEGRVAFRRAMKKSIATAMRMGDAAVMRWASRLRRNCSKSSTVTRPPAPLPATAERSAALSPSSVMRARIRAEM